VLERLKREEEIANKKRLERLAERDVVYEENLQESFKVRQLRLQRERQAREMVQEKAKRIVVE